ncbi:hypothetical protein H0H81_001077 [Sphagnurus paluster]|uniref:NAD(P)-binding protein n=1 Tax=Sphagnurus paluster TaxID=117069 RepID=A0A9P7GG54_9AGAR|nr:hypothetical protein H0H81_001077 [Sphagnurus paluster]
MSTFEVQNLFSVKGKVVLVTGGSRGIGKMISTGFVRNGAKVYVTSRTAKDCEETAKELTALGPGICISLPANLQKYEEVERLANELSSRESAVHILVNNAGALWNSPIDDFPDAAFAKVFTLNLQRIFTVTQKLLPLLRAGAAAGKNGKIFEDPARIINIGSIEGLSLPHNETYAYTASKAALHHLMTAHALKTVGVPLLASTPAQRFGKAEDAAGTALFLASPAASWINGATIILDGGLLLSRDELKQAALTSMSKL